MFTIERSLKTILNQCSESRQDYSNGDLSQYRPFMIWYLMVLLLRCGKSQILSSQKWNLWAWLGQLGQSVFSLSTTMNWLLVLVTVVGPILEAIANNTHLQMSSRRVDCSFLMDVNTKRHDEFPDTTCSGNNKIIDAECSRSKVRLKNTSFYSICL